MRRALLTALLLGGLLAPAAHAGTPFTVGEGRDPHLVVDVGGTAHVVWHDETQKVFYCQVPRDASTCTIQSTLEVGADADSAYILAAGGGTLYIVMPHYVQDKTFLWVSTNNGGTWSARQQIYGHGGGTNSSEPIIGPKTGEITFASANPTSDVWGAALDGGETTLDTEAQLVGGGGYDVQVAPTGDNGLVAVANDLNNASFFRMGPGGEPSDDGAWSGATPLGEGKETRVDGGPGGTFMLSTVTTAPAHQDIRKWNGTGFNPPVSIPEYGYVNDIHVAPSGAVAAIWRLNATDPANRLRMALSTDGGATFATRSIAIEDAVMASMDIALAPDNAGFATYEGKGGSNGARSIIRVVDTTDAEPATAGASPGDGSEPPSLRRRTLDIGGARLRLDVPGNCIPRSGKFSTRLSVKRFPRRGTFRNVKRVDFFIGLKRVKRDRKPPFIQTITIPGPVAGKTYTLRTRALIKRRGKRKLQRRSLSVKITVCG